MANPSSGDGPAVSLADTLELVAAVKRLAEPVTYRRLLQLIVETAASVIGAETGSLFLIDDDSGELSFEVALGLSEEDAAAIRLAPGEGIAGMVASTGQPVAIRNLEQDPRHAASVAQRLGHTPPRSVLCVPLYIDDTVVGVLELLNKQDAEGFDPGDMATMALFANQAAVAIVQSRAQQRLHQLVGRITGTGSPQTQTGSDGPLSEQAASVLAAIAARGEGELLLALEILRVIANRDTGVDRR